MRPSVLKILLSVSGAVIVMGCQSPVGVQNATREQGNGVAKTALSNLAYGGNSGYTDGTGTSGSLQSTNAPGGFGLNGFRYNFKNSGRHVQKIEAALYSKDFNGSAAPNTWSTTYKDVNSKCPHWADIGWQELPAGTVHGSKVITSDVPETVIDLGPCVPGTIPVLTGFSMSDLYTDAHVEWVAVWLVTQNDPAMDRIFGRGSGPVFDPNYVKAWVKFTGKPGRGSRGKIKFGISYAMVPANKIKSSNNFIEDGYTNQKEKSGNVRNGQSAVLQGFSLMLGFGREIHIDRLGIQVANNSWRVTAEDGNMWSRFVFKWAEVMR